MEKDSRNERKNREGVLVENIEITEVTACHSDLNRIIFLAQADKRLGKILPILYLNQPNAKYSKALGSVSYMYGQHLVTLFSTGKIGITYVKDIDEAKQLVDEVKNLINRAFMYYLSYGKPAPELLKLKKKVSPMEIYKNLPRTNCKECGESGCYTFAIRLASGEKRLHHCPPLQSSEYAEKRAYLSKVLQLIKL